MPFVDEDADAAWGLALEWGCDPENPCWDECWSKAYDLLEETRDVRSEYRSTQ